MNLNELDTTDFRQLLQISVLQRIITYFLSYLSLSFYDVVSPLFCIRAVISQTDSDIAVINFVFSWFLTN